MAMLIDIQKADEWIVQCFRTEGTDLDHSIGSVQHIEEFFLKYSKDGEAVSGSPLSQALGQICFGLGAYIGNTLIRNVGGDWNVGEDDEIGIEVSLDNGNTCWPVQRVMKRLKNGPEDNVYHYAVVIADSEDKSS